MGAKRLLVIFIVTAATLSSTQAQISKSITKVLDNCAKTFKSAGDVKAQFVATQFEGRDEIGSSRGTISISGKKLFIDNGGVKIWYDGKTQWSLNEPVFVPVDIQKRIFGNHDFRNGEK